MIDVLRVLYVGRSFGVHDRRFVAAFAAPQPAGAGWQVACVALDRRATVDLPAGVVSIEGSIAGSEVDHVDRCISIERVAEAARRFEPDVVVAGPLQDAALAAVRAAAAPVVAISWAFDLLVDGVKDEGRRDAAEVLARAAALVCDAEVVAHAAVRLGMDRTRIVIAPWGVDLGRFAGGDRRIRDELGWSKAFIILSTRSHEPQYGLETVIDAAGRAAQRIPSLRLVMLGDGSRRSELEERARACGLTNAVHFAGRVDEAALPRWYSAADLFISSSHSDGSSVSLMEALASGLPVAVSNTPGNREWVQSGANGWLFPIGDAEALAAAIIEAAQLTESRRTQMSRSARRVAERRADWGRNVQRITQAIAVVVRSARL